MQPQRHQGETSEIKKAVLVVLSCTNRVFSGSDISVTRDATTYGGAYGLRSSAPQVSRVKTGGSAGPLLAVAALLACPEAGRIEADAFTSTPTSTSYQLL
jgi:hypothetical protein